VQIVTDQIKHIVVLLLENRSFDHMLGDLHAEIPALNGIDQAHPKSNTYEGKPYPHQPGAARSVSPDPRHEYEHVMRQIKHDNAGFVADFAEAYPHASENQWAEVMRYHARGSLAALHTLARNFLVCDRWYASVPGPTWPNRLFAMSGTSLGRVTMPEGLFSWNLHWYDQPTIFDRLNEREKSWHVYYTDFALSFLLVHQWEPANAAKYRRMTQFYKDAAGKADNFPDFAFIEPAYMPPGANDDHPPHDAHASDVLMANVYNAIRGNDLLWKETLLVIYFDEHGGFYDHEPPIPLEPPDSRQGDGFQFNLSGVRVPAILISPWLRAGVLSTPFDHTSLLKYLVEKWQLGDLGNRTANAKTFANEFSPVIRPNAPARIDVPVQMAQHQPAVPDRLTSGQSAMVALSHALESMAGDNPTTVAARSQHSLSGPQAHLDVAMDRLESFIQSLVGKLK
jgi:phospholipase C